MKGKSVKNKFGVCSLFLLLIEKEGKKKRLVLALLAGVTLLLGSTSAQALYLYGNGTGCPGNWDATTKTCTLTEDWIDYEGITITDADGLTLDCVGHMIQAEMESDALRIQYDCENVTVKNCVLKSMFDACIRASGSGHMIADNAFVGCQDGLYGQMEHVTFTRNTLTDVNNRGIAFYYNPPSAGRQFNTISDNIFNGGYRAMWIASKNNVITDNELLNQSHYGMELTQETDNNLVEGNLIHGAGLIGLHLWSAQGNTVRCNEITENEVGIVLDTRDANPAPSDNLINDNSVYGNIQYELQRITGENNDLTDNYWGADLPECSRFSGISCPADLEPYRSETPSCGQQCFPQPDGLISWWPGEENANDIVGSNHGTLEGGATGPATFGTGKVGQAFSLDGIDDYVAIPESQSLDFSAAVTIQAWVNINDFPTGGWPNANMQVLQKTGTVYAHAYALVVLGELGNYAGMGEPRPKRFGLELTVNNQWSGNILANGAWSATELIENTWHHLVATYDGNQINLYLDGQLDASYIITGAIETNDIPVRIGNWGVAEADHFNGLIDEVQVFNRALSGSEILAIFNAGSAGLCETQNQPPTADAGGPYLAAVGETIPIDGDGSDPDEDALTYGWTATSGSFDDATLEDPDYTAGSEAGIFDLTLTVTDPGGLSDSDTAMVVVYDPEGGFVTGGGWIWSEAGYCQLDDVCANAEGKATFGFVSKYKKGANVPTGQTEFQFHAGNLNFHSDSYDWLVVTGSDYAKFKGSGTINGEGDYKFMIWAGDHEPDTFRIKIWTEDETGVETVVYDNGFGQPISGGSIKIHKKK